MNPFSYDYAVIGGDMRQVYLARYLSLYSNAIACYALYKNPDTDDPTDSTGPKALASLEELTVCSCVVGPVPFSKNGVSLNQFCRKNEIVFEELLSALTPGQLLFGGCIPKDFRSAAEKKGVQTFDLLDDIPLAFFNSIATAEGAVCEAIRCSPVNLYHSRCAIFGYGKCGTTLNRYLKNMFCYTYVAADLAEERAKASLTADWTGTIEEAYSSIGSMDFIFNTIPDRVITEEFLSRMKPTVTIIDIASPPGGVDYAAAEKLNRNARLCPGLPGRYAPASSAKAICETIQKIQKEQQKCH